jgi:hypothetical protein
MLHLMRVGDRQVQFRDIRVDDQVVVQLPEGRQARQDRLRREIHRETRGAPVLEVPALCERRGANFVEIGGGLSTWNPGFTASTFA